MLTLSDIYEAQKRLSPYVFRTPVIRLKTLDEALHCKVYVKAENMQKINAFKIRGALNKALQLSPETLKNGIVTASSGNHGRGVAFAGKLLGVPVTVVMPEHAPEVKKAAIKALGAEIVLCEKSQRFVIAERITKEKGACFIHPFDDYDIMAGQGTAGLEMMNQLPKVDKIVVPVGGGGLISGIATAVKGTRDSVKVYGAEPALCARYTESFKKEEPTLVTIGDTIADGTMTAKPGEKTFPIVREKVDGIIPVEEKFIHRAVKLLLLEGKILAEPSSCMTLGAALQGALPVKEDDNVIFFLSGGNVGLSLIEKICAEK